MHRMITPQRAADQEANRRQKIPRLHLSLQQLLLLLLERYDVPPRPIARQHTGDRRSRWEPEGDLLLRGIGLGRLGAGLLQGERKRGMSEVSRERREGQREGTGDEGKR